MPDNDRTASETLYIPTEDSQGTAYHSAYCGVHLLRELPRDDAAEIIRIEGLTPCGNCLEHHGLRPLDIHIDEDDDDALH